MFHCRKSAGKDFKSPAQLFSFSKGWKTDVLIFQRWAEPLAEAGDRVLPMGRYYKSPLISQHSCDLEYQTNYLV